jgi:hypothetical protein
LHAYAILGGSKTFAQRLNLLFHPSNRKQCLFMRRTILDLRPISARRFDGAKPFAAFFDGLVTDIKRSRN